LTPGLAEDRIRSVVSQDRPEPQATDSLPAALPPTLGDLDCDVADALVNLVQQLRDELEAAAGLYAYAIWDGEYLVLALELASGAARLTLRPFKCQEVAPQWLSTSTFEAAELLLDKAEDLRSMTLPVTSQVSSLRRSVDTVEQTAPRTPDGNA
jgi:hypothetical protein